MSETTQYVNQWNIVLNQSKELRTSLNQLLITEELNQILIQEITDPDTQLKVLNLILFSQWEFEEIARIYPVIIDIALKGTVEAQHTARSIVYKYGLFDMQVTINIISGYLEKKDFCLYRDIAELLLGIYDPVIVKILLSLCRSSHDPDICQIYEEYRHVID